MRINSFCKNKILFFFLFFGIFIYYSNIASSEENKKFKIIPLPKRMFFKGFDVSLDKNWDIIVDRSNREDYFTAKELKEKLYNDYNLLLPIKGTSFVLKKQDKHIVLGNPFKNENVHSVCSNRDIHLDKNFNEEGYLLEIFYDNMIVIVGNSSKGVFYGMQTLKQLFDKDDNDRIKVKAVKIKDWPDYKVRGVHFCGIKTSEMYKVIDKMAYLKMNAAIFERDYWYNYDLKQIRDFLEYKELFDYCRKRHIKPIPCIQNFGIAFSVLREDPHCAEGVWVEDEKFKFVNDIAQPVMSSNVLVKNSSFEIDDNNDNIPDDWLFYTEIPCCSENYWFWDDTTSHSGSHSVKVTMNSYSSSNPLVQVHKVEPKTVYSLTFYAKKSTGSTSGYSIAMRISQWDKNNKFIVENYFPVKSETWKRHVFNFVTQPNCTCIHIAPSIINGKGTAWFDDIELKRMNGSLVNVIRTETSDINITNLDKTITYREGIDYKIIDGDMRYCDYGKGDAYPYDFTNRAPSKIKRLEGGRIADGETVLVSYDFVLQFNPFPWKCTYCPCEQRTYEILFESLGALVKSPLVTDYIVIGDTEVFGMNRDSRCLKADKTNAELLADDINKIYKFLNSIKPNIKILIYDDMLNPYHFGGRHTLQMVYGGRVKGGTSDAIDLIPKDIIPIIWWYGSEDSKGKMKNSPNYYKSKNLSYLIATWYDEENIKMWIDILKKRKESLGMINTNWPDTPKGFEWKGLEFTANHSWNIMEEVVDE